MIDVGAQGRQSDSGVFNNSNIGQNFNNGTWDLPDAKKLCPEGPVLPYYLIGDEAFGLKPFLQRPYPGRSKGNLQFSQQLFNYRLSRARRVIENSFGILAAKWRIFRKPIQAKVDTVDHIVKAAVCLHNFVMMEEEKFKPSQRCYSTLALVDRDAIHKLSY